MKAIAIDGFGVPPSLHDLPVPDGTPGELIVRHRWPWVINSGYRGMPEATALK